MVVRVVLARCPSNLISQPRSNGSMDSADGDSGRSKMQILPASRWPKLPSRTFQRCDARMRRAVAEMPPRCGIHALKHAGPLLTKPCCFLIRL
jgi:hypothetical protein